MLNQRGAAYMAWVAWRLGLSPSAVSLLNLGIGLGASAAVIALAPSAAAGSVPWWPLGVGVLVLWQVAYMLDCADGQLARVTGTGSAAGARCDILIDVAVQASVVAVVAAVTETARPESPAWLYAAFAGTWMTNLVTSILAKDPDSQASLITSDNLVIRLVKLVRDFSALVLVIGLVIAFAPTFMFWVMVALTMVNSGFLLASILAASKASGPISRSY